MITVGARVRNLGRYRQLQPVGTVVEVTDTVCKVAWDTGGWSSGFPVGYLALMGPDPAG